MSSIYADAILIAKHCLEQEIVKAVWLFGGVARTGNSHHDIDLVFEVDDEVFYRFMDTLSKREPGFVAEGLYGDSERKQSIPEVRYDIAREILNAPIRPYRWVDRPLSNFSEQVAAGMLIDVFMLPTNWQQRAEEIDNLYPSKDGTLIQRIAGTSYRFDPSLERFVAKDGVPLIFKTAPNTYV